DVAQQEVPDREAAAGELHLSGKQRGDLAKVLIDVLPDRNTLSRMLRYKLDRSLDSIAFSGDLATTMFQVVEAAHREGWTAKLIAAARESNPGNPALQAFAAQFGLASSTPDQPVLERVISSSNPMIDPQSWRTRLGLIEAQVCRIEVAGGNRMLGTEFLVGPDLVMTAFPLIADVVSGRVRPREVTLRFDYKQLQGAAR